MTDIYIGLAVMLVVCIAAFITGVTIARRVPKRVAATLAILDLAALLLFLKLGWDAPILTQLIPFKNVIVLGNFQPPIVALLAGLTWSMMPRSTTRRLVYIVPLLLVSQWRAYGRLLEAPPETRQRWRGDVCRQTSNATCSAAASATLLRAHGITATETEMAGLSLTRAEGTTVHGRYRGLSIKTDGTPWRVEPVVSADIASLRSLTPLLISVGLPRGAGDAVSKRYIDDYGWIPGQRHTVVLFGFTADGKLDIGDPSVGREEWDLDDLKVLWEGNGFRLVKR